MPCRIYKLDFREKNLNLDRDLNHESPNPGSGSNFSLENLICKFFIFLISLPTYLKQSFD